VFNYFLTPVLQISFLNKISNVAIDNFDLKKTFSFNFSFFLVIFHIFHYNLLKISYFWFNVFINRVLILLHCVIYYDINVLPPYCKETNTLCQILSCETFGIFWLITITLYSWSLIFFGIITIFFIFQPYNLKVNN